MRSRRIIGVVIGAMLAMSLSPQAASASAPKLLAAPTLPAVAGTNTVVKVTAGKWSATASRSYSWTLNGKAVAGATGTSFKVKATQLGKSLRVIEKARFAGGKSLTAASKPLALGRILVSGAPTIGYSDDTQKVLKVTSMPSIQPANATVAFEWQHPPFAVPTSTNADSYTVATADEGNDVGVELTINAKGYLTQHVSSNAVTVTKKTRVYQQIWSDEFNGPAGGSFDPATWAAQESDGSAYRNKGWGNNEREWYLGSLSTTDGNGNLNLDATTNGASDYKCYYGQCEWLSSKLITLGKVGFKYGRIEARIKGTPGLGTWPAFWMLGTDITQWGWPSCGEIDITELLGRDPNTTYGTLHGPNSGGGGRGGTSSIDGGWAGGYHTYAIDWLPDQITWYIDGVAYHTENKLNDGDWVFDHEFYLILNLAMGGNFTGAIDPTLTSANMSVDWVRVSTINGVGEVIQH